MQSNRMMIGNTVTMAGIAACLGYMAYETGWHAVLFGFLAFSAYSVGNRISIELAMTRAALTRSNNPSKWDG
jgi:hypothetical protein